MALIFTNSNFNLQKNASKQLSDANLDEYFTEEYLATHSITNHKRGLKIKSSLVRTTDKFADIY